MNLQQFSMNLGGSGGAASGANQTLSNLNSPTAINQDLLPTSPGSNNIGNGTSYWNNIYGANIYCTTLFTQGVNTTLQQSGGGLWQQLGVNYLRFNNDPTYTGIESMNRPVTWTTDGGNSVGLATGGRPGAVFAVNQIDTAGVFSCRGKTIITSGTTSTVGANIGVVAFNPTSAISSYTLTMPVSPQDGMQLVITAGAFGVSTFSAVANSGQTLISSPTTLGSASSVRYLYDSSTTVWFRG